MGLLKRKFPRGGKKALETLLMEVLDRQYLDFQQYPSDDHIYYLAVWATEGKRAADAALKDAERESQDGV